MMKAGLGCYQLILLPPGSFCQLERCYSIKEKEVIWFSKKFKRQDGKFKFKTPYHHPLTRCKLELGIGEKRNNND